MPRRDKRDRKQERQGRSAAASGRGGTGGARASVHPIARRSRTRFLWIAAVALVAVAVAALVLLSGGEGTQVASAEERVQLEGADHVPEGTNIVYRSYPPASGPHYGRTASYGVHTEEVPEGYWVHNLEHGAIVVLYNCPEGCPGLVDQLRELYNTAPKGKYGQVKMVVAPYSRMDSRLALLAWGWREKLQDFDRERILRFYRAHVDRGPEDVP